MTKAVSRAFALCVALLGAARAEAQSASAQAEAMFREGRALIAAGKIAEACAAFESSQQLEPATSTLMNLASCRERNGQLATAWGLFLDAARATRDGAGATDKKLNRVAGERAKRLEPRLSRLTINVPPGSRIGGLEVLRAAVVLEPAMWNRAIPVDGGTYQVAARAPGATIWTASVTVGKEGDTKIVDVPRLTRPETVASAPPAVQDAPAMQEAPAPVSPRAVGDRTPPVLRPVLAIGGGALMVGALVVYLWGRSDYAAAGDEPRDQARRDALYEDANGKRHIAIGMGVAGIACGGIAAWLYLRGHAEPDTRRAHVAPLLGAGTGLAVHGAF